MKKNKYNVAVIGVGVVGIEMLRVLRQRNFPVGTLRVFARSAREIEVDGQKYVVQAVSPEGFNGIFSCNQNGSYAMSVGALGASGGVYVPVADASVELNTGIVNVKVQFYADDRVRVVKWLPGGTPKKASLVVIQTNLPDLNIRFLFDNLK